MCFFALYLRVSATQSRIRFLVLFLDRKKNNEKKTTTWKILMMRTIEFIQLEYSFLEQKFYLRTHVGSSLGDQSPVAWQKRSDLPTNSKPSPQ